MQWTPFGVGLNNEPISKTRFSRSLKTGIEVDPKLPGMVSLYEEREAARHSLIPWPDWGDLPHSERVGLIAYHRVCIYIDFQKSEVSAKAAEAQAKKGRRGRGRGR